MLSFYVLKDGHLERLSWEVGRALADQTVWIDIVSPSHGEDKYVESLTGIEIPTREEMQEIEVSSRLYIENGARYMTATLICRADTPSPATTPVTFILAGGRLITVRYDDPRPFALISNKLGKACPLSVTGETVLLELLDAIIDRTADILEQAAVGVDMISHQIFEPTERRADRSRTYNHVLRMIGRKGDIASKAREALVSIGRMLLFLANEADSMKWPKEKRASLKVMQRDVISLTDHASYLNNKIQFLLDAMLGMVSIEQNNIIKLFSVASVALTPPILIASIYGMNFKNMPELSWTYGYPLALILMLIAGVVPYFYFKWRRWL